MPLLVNLNKNLKYNDSSEDTTARPLSPLPEHLSFSPTTTNIFDLSRVGKSSPPPKKSTHSINEEDLKVDASMPSVQITTPMELNGLAEESDNLGISNETYLCVRDPILSNHFPNISNSKSSFPRGLADNQRIRVGEYTKALMGICSTKDNNNTIKQTNESPQQQDNDELTIAVRKIEIRDNQSKTSIEGESPMKKAPNVRRKTLHALFVDNKENNDDGESGTEHKNVDIKCNTESETDSKKMSDSGENEENERLDENNEINNVDDELDEYERMYFYEERREDSFNIETGSLANEAEFNNRGEGDATNYYIEEDDEYIIDDIENEGITFGDIYDFHSSADAYTENERSHKVYMEVNTRFEMIPGEGNSSENTVVYENSRIFMDYSESGSRTSQDVLVVNESCDNEESYFNDEYSVNHDIDYDNTDLLVIDDGHSRGSFFVENDDRCIFDEVDEDNVSDGCSSNSSISIGNGDISPSDNDDNEMNDNDYGTIDNYLEDDKDVIDNDTKDHSINNLDDDNYSNDNDANDYDSNDNDANYYDSNDNDANDYDSNDNDYKHGYNEIKSEFKSRSSNDMKNRKSNHSLSHIEFSSSQNCIETTCSSPIQIRQGGIAYQLGFSASSPILKVERRESKSPPKDKIEHNPVQQVEIKEMSKTNPEEEEERPSFPKKAKLPGINPSLDRKASRSRKSNSSNVHPRVMLYPRKSNSDIDNQGKKNNKQDIPNQAFQARRNNRLPPLNASISVCKPLVTKNKKEKGDKVKKIGFDLEPKITLYDLPSAHKFNNSFKRPDLRTNKIPKRPYRLKPLKQAKSSNPLKSLTLRGKPLKPPKNEKPTDYDIINNRASGPGFNTKLDEEKSPRVPYRHLSFVKHSTCLGNNIFGAWATDDHNHSSI